MNIGSASPSALSINALVFSGGEIQSEDDLNLDVLDTVAPGLYNVSANEVSSPDEGKRVSTYVKIFEDMVGTVIKHERELLSVDELALLATFAHLSYNARFLMVRLLLRKRDTWHRLDALKYEDELGSARAIIDAIDELCQTGPDAIDDVKKEEEEEQEEREIIDLTSQGSVMNIEDEPPQSATTDTEGLQPAPERKPVALAWCEQQMELRELLDCLKLEELKAVAKTFQLKINQKKEVLINELLRSSSSQLTLAGFARREGSSSQSRGCLRHGKAPGKLKSQQDRLRELVLDALGRCIRVDGEFFSVIYRVNLVYFRITQYTPGILVAALLSRFNKRAYASYECERTMNIWPDRQSLLDYEEALILEGEVDLLLAGNVPPLGGRATGSKTPAARVLLTPVTPGSANSKKEGKDPDPEVDTLDVKPDSVRVRGARKIKDIFERVYPRWLDLVKVKAEEKGRAYGLERFHCGHVFTRIICKGCNALAALGDHERELEVLEALLAQKRWRRGRRGMWHERRALILCTHFPKDEGTSERALDAVIDALKDPDTHIVYRPKLLRRLKRLENKLKIPIRERHECDGSLAVAEEVEFEATRLKHRAASLKLDRTGRTIKDATSQNGNQDTKRFYFPTAASVTPESSSSAAPASGRQPSPKGKSIWLGRGCEELTVEGLALQRYEDQGFKGVHCETRIISMLFGLLFWDVIFAPIPGAFETPYQTAPLDIGEDSFYISRMDRMEERLVAIEAGQAVELIQEVDSKHRADKTWCVGVQWDLFTYEDLVDIVKCIGGKALAVIFRMLCEDYSAWQSGGPDLFLWNPEKGICKFVEVKGPGDTLQENQKLWIDVLLRAPVPVEVCRVKETGSEADKKPKTRTPKTVRKTPKKRVAGSKSPQKKKTGQEMVESEDEDDTLPSMASEGQRESTVPRASPERADQPPSNDEGEPSSPLKRKRSRVEVVLPSQKRPKA